MIVPTIAKLPPCTQVDELRRVRGEGDRGQRHCHLLQVLLPVSVFCLLLPPYRFLIEDGGDIRWRYELLFFFVFNRHMEVLFNRLAVFWRDSGRDWNGTYWLVQPYSSMTWLLGSF